jgi:hypothetical protein
LEEIYFSNFTILVILVICQAESGDWIIINGFPSQ